MAKLIKYKKINKNAKNIVCKKKNKENNKKKFVILRKS